MKTKTLAVIITFASLAIVLNPAISGIGVPFPFLPTLIFQIWEIPTVVALLLFGFKTGLPVAVINSVFLVTVYPGMSRPLYGIGSFFSVTSMMVGFILVYRFLARGNLQDNRFETRAKAVAISISAAILFRVAVMALYMYIDLSFLTYPPITSSRLFSIVLPFQAVFNIIIPLYMLPAGYAVARLISRNLKVGGNLV